MFLKTLFTLLILVTCLGPQNLLAQTQDNSAPPVAVEDEPYSNVLQIPADDGAMYDRLFKLAYKIQMDRDFYKFLNGQFKDYLVIPDYMQKAYNLPDKSSGFTTTQLVLFLQNSHEFEALTTQYFASKSTAKLSAATTQSVTIAITKDILQNATLVTTMKRLADPSQPLALLSHDGSPGYSDIRTYVNHPRLSDPSDINSAVIPADNLVDVVVKFIDRQNKEIWMNTFEFNHPKIAEAILRALARGVKVRLGIDKNTLEHTQLNKDVWAMLSAVTDKKVTLAAGAQKYKDLIDSIKNPDLILTPVDPESINHQKIIAGDPEEPTAEVLISSGNMTVNCLDCRSHAFDNPAPELDIAVPNANHIITFKSQIGAMIIRNELSKTIVDKLKGRTEYPISGSYIFYGKKEDGMKKPPYIFITFSPNGGIGSIERDVLARLILGTTGPIIMGQYAFASPIVLDALIERFKKEKAEGHPVEFTFVGETNFVMQPYSSVLALAGYKLNDKTKMYEEDPNAKVRTVLNDQEIKQLRERIFIPPPQYSDRYIVLPGVKNKYKLSAIMHHKLMAFVNSHIVTAAKSYNVSQGAEENQEQVPVTNDPAVFKVLHGALEWLFKNAAHNIAAEVQLRNTQEAAKSGKSHAADSDNKDKTEKTPEKKAAAQDSGAKCETNVKKVS